MKINAFLLYISLGSLLISCQPKLTAEAIVKKSLAEAHGGTENWELPKTLLYEKTTTLYDSSGTIESQKKQRFYNTLQPEFTSEVTWEENGIDKRIVYNGKAVFVFFNGIPQKDLKIIKNASQEVVGAQYVLWQPYKVLTDTDATLELEGKVRLEDGSEAFKIRVIYPNDRVVWWYYFDANTFLFKENLVQHGTTYSQIKNIKHEEKTGLYLHKERKSYMIDSSKNKKYLRAHYYYNILKLK